MRNTGATQCAKAELAQRSRRPGVRCDYKILGTSAAEREAEKSDPGTVVHERASVPQEVRGGQDALGKGERGRG